MLTTDQQFRGLPDPNLGAFAPDGKNGKLLHFMHKSRKTKKGKIKFLKII